MPARKCVYFYKGYCKNKDSCSLKHPLLKCDGFCKEKRICPKRHRVACKNEDLCIFMTSSEIMHKTVYQSTSKENY